MSAHGAATHQATPAVDSVYVPDDAGPRVRRRSPPLSAGVLAGESRLVLCIDAVA